VTTVNTITVVAATDGALPVASTMILLTFFDRLSGPECSTTGHWALALQLWFKRQLET
jgi:hypothetical protein